MISTGLDARTKRIIVGVAHAVVPGVRVYLFGSRARGTQGDRSDIDIALDAGKQLPIIDVGEVRDMLNESNISLKIDVVDVHAVSEAMRNAILHEGIIWSE